jgi:guanyl-specific ribonuclease Sa
LDKLRLLLFFLLLPLIISVGTAGCDFVAPLLEQNSSAISINNLPDEAIDTIELIKNGGPFPYKQDGDVYYNREGLLPKQSDGYYHVYTVETPGDSGKGDRRIVTGKNAEYYYTADHYGSFRTITDIAGSIEGKKQNQPAASTEIGLNKISVNDLPPEARETLRLIKKGGPFPYKQDNTVFSNYEGVLPKQSGGYYHEYTVITPGASNRGARRIVAGTVGEYYYTSDHYGSFKRIVE